VSASQQNPGTSQTRPAAPSSKAHVLAARGFVQELLAGTSQLRILVTSRSPLRLAGEQEFPVPALRVPESGGAPSVTAVAACESAQLFAARAAALVPGFAIDEQNAGPIAGIVERGGLPLAARPTVQRTVSSRGGIQVARQRIQVGISHAGQTVTAGLGDTTVRVTGQHGELITIVPRNSTGEISRFKAYGSRRRTEAVPGPSAAGVVHEASGQQDAVSGEAARDKPGDILWSSRNNGRRGGGRGRRRA